MTMPLFLIIIINVWIILQVGSELLARWLEKKWEKYLKKQEEKNYGSGKIKELGSSRHKYKD